jgi:hypothetical protein
MERKIIVVRIPMILIKIKVKIGVMMRICLKHIKVLKRKRI